MADFTTTPAVGDATKVTDFAQLLAGINAVRESDKDFGGDLREGIADTAYVDMPNSWEQEIDGTNLAGRSVYLEHNWQAFKDGGSAWSGTVTATIRLWNVTTGAVVAGSETAIVISTGARVRNISTALTLASGVNRYKVEIKTSDATRVVAALAKVTIR